MASNSIIAKDPTVEVFDFLQISGAGKYPNEWFAVNQTVTRVATAYHLDLNSLHVKIFLTHLCIQFLHEISGTKVTAVKVPQNAAEYEKQPAVKTAMWLVRSCPELLRSGSWSGFKIRLWKRLNPKLAYPGAKWDVPAEYIYVQKRLVCGWKREDAYQQVVGR